MCNFFVVFVVDYFLALLACLSPKHQTVYISLMQKSLWLEIAPGPWQKALIHFWQNALRNYQIPLASSLEHASAILSYGPQLKSTLPQFNCPQAPLESQIEICPHTGFWGPKQMQIHIHQQCVETNVDLFRFLAQILFGAHELQAPHAHASLHGLSLDISPFPHEFWDQPVVDQWTRWILQQLLGPVQTVFESQGLKIWLTHDVDNLLRWNFKRILWHLGTSPFAALIKPRQWYQECLSLWQSLVHQKDPLDCIQKVIECDQGRPATYFVMGWPKDHLVRRYDIRKSRYQKILRQIPQAGASIGLHGSPLHPSSAQLLATEKRRIEHSLQVQIKAQRMHFLRFDIAQSPRAAHQAGLLLDSSLGFNDRPGFRMGSALPFQWFDLGRQEALSLIMVPLIYADHQRQDWIAQSNPLLIQELKTYLERCQSVGAPCTVLFHDLYFSTLINSSHVDFYQHILHEINISNSEYCQIQDFINIHEAFLAQSPRPLP